jgi:hypothetical protein
MDLLLGCDQFGYTQKKFISDLNRRLRAVKRNF